MLSLHQTNPIMCIDVHKTEGLRREEFDQIQSVRKEYKLQNAKATAHISVFYWCTSTNC